MNPYDLEPWALLRELAAAGHEVWVYTTSYRNPAAVRWWLWFHGIRVPRVIAQAEHERQFGNGGPSKHARAFGIDLHVDDSWGVWVEGRQHRFAVVVVTPDDPDWADRVRRSRPSPGPGVYRCRRSISRPSSRATSRNNSRRSGSS